MGTQYPLLHQSITGNETFVPVCFSLSPSLSLSLSLPLSLSNIIFLPYYLVDCNIDQSGFYTTSLLDPKQMIGQKWSRVINLLRLFQLKIPSQLKHFLNNNLRTISMPLPLTDMCENFKGWWTRLLKLPKVDIFGRFGNIFGTILLSLPTDLVARFDQDPPVSSTTTKCQTSAMIQPPQIMPGPGSALSRQCVGPSSSTGKAVFSWSREARGVRKSSQ